jgi:hypothetical protein
MVLPKKSRSQVSYEPDVLGGIISKAKKQIDTLDVDHSESNLLALIGVSVVLLLLSRLAIEAASWSRHRELLTNFFEDKTEFMLAVTAYIPVIVLIAMLTMASRKNFKIVSVLGFIYGAGFWFMSYNFTVGARAIFSQFSGFAAMPSGLADWWTIPDLVACKLPTDCDRLGRPPIYGHGWKLLVPLANDRVALILGGLMAGFVCYSIGKFSHGLKVPAAALMVFLSPSMIFSLERGQSDIFVVGLILIFLSIKKVNSVVQVLVTMFLVSLKPFYVVAYLRSKPKISRILLFAPLFLLTYLVSMNFKFAEIKYARVATVYPPKYQIGVDQIPSMAIQLFDKKFQVDPLVWKGAESFKYSLIAGLILFALVYFSSIKYSLRHLNVLSLDSLELSERNIVLVFSSLYLLVYLSGSQVAYKAWVVFPVLILSLSRFLQLKERANPAVIVFLSLILFGGFAIDIWALRAIGGFVLAVYCAQIVSYFYRESLPLFKIGRK